jgi:formylglycine-generating enzyme required for sulfatase activity
VPEARIPSFADEVLTSMGRTVTILAMEHWGVVPDVVNGTIVTCDFTKDGYRLPAEAEREYAARGGSQSRGYTYAGGEDLGAVAWYGANSGNATHAVGTKGANELEIFDMSGNVAEWCWDWKASYAAAAQMAPTGPESGFVRVVRGGSANYDPTYARSSSRHALIPTYTSSGYGLRVVRRAVDPAP